MLRSDENPSNWDPSDKMECLNVEVDEKKLEDEGWEDEYLEEDDNGQEMLAEYKWKVLRKPVLEEPVFKDVKYEPKPGERLFDKFRESGLQIIVKMASIELTPEKPYFPQGGWHVEVSFIRCDCVNRTNKLKRVGPNERIDSCYGPLLCR